MKQIWDGGTQTQFIGMTTHIEREGKNALAVSIKKEINVMPSNPKIILMPFWKVKLTENVKISLNKKGDYFAS